MPLLYKKIIKKYYSDIIKWLSKWKHDYVGSQNTVMEEQNTVSQWGTATLHPAQLTKDNMSAYQ